MRTISKVKVAGYLVSSVSVVLLAVPALQSADGDPLMLACLVAGMASSIGGMALRWHSHRLEQAQKRRPNWR